VSESTPAEGLSAGDYIQHHLTNWCIGCDPKTNAPSGIIDFNAFYVDSVLFAWLLAGLLMWIAWKVGRNLEPDQPTGLQNVLEALVEFVNQQVKDIFPGTNPIIGPLALTIFMWVFFMNALDLIPVDLLPGIAAWLGQHLFGMDPHHVFLRMVPTANLDTPFALALSVFGLIIFYNARTKGTLGYVKVFLFHPFGKYLMPLNIVMTAVEEVAKPISLGMRLFGNMFAGELLFVLIATLSFSWFVLPAQVALDTAWAIYHLLVITIQAFIFMLLTIVYLSLAHQEAH
jgi:F-type H+-transporting ATPase subunit a